MEDDHKWWVDKVLEGVGYGLFESTWHSAGGTKGNHDKPPSG